MISAAIFGTGPTLFRAPFTFLPAAAPRRSIAISSPQGFLRRFRVNFIRFCAGMRCTIEMVSLFFTQVQRQIHLSSCEVDRHSVKSQEVGLSPLFANLTRVCPPSVEGDR